MNRLKYFYIPSTTIFNLRNKLYLECILKNKSGAKTANLESAIDVALSADEEVFQNPSKENLKLQKEAYAKLTDTNTFWYGSFKRAKKIKSKLQKLNPDFFAKTCFEDNGWKLYPYVTFVANRFGVTFNVSWKTATTSQSSTNKKSSGKYEVDLHILKGVYGIDIESEHPLVVNGGESATFTVSFDEGYSKDNFMLSNGAYWDSDNTIKIDSVNSNMTIYISRQETVTIDGLEYKVVQIGNQKWLAENLQASFEQSEHGRYGMFYDTDETKYGRQGLNYGRLYFWNEAVEVANKIDGWHLPTETDFETLKSYVGSNSGTKLKSRSGWEDSNGTDSFNFNALPAGKFFNGEYLWANKNCGFWTATEEPGHNINAKYYRLDSSSTAGSELDTRVLNEEISIKEFTALSIRLVKD